MLLLVFIGKVSGREEGANGSEGREADEIQIHEHENEENLKQEAGEQHTLRMCYITFYSRCHNTVSSVQSKICTP